MTSCHLPIATSRHLRFAILDNHSEIDRNIIYDETRVYIIDKYYQNTCFLVERSADNVKTMCGNHGGSTCTILYSRVP